MFTVINLFTPKLSLYGFQQDENRFIRGRGNKKTCHFQRNGITKIKGFFNLSSMPFTDVLLAL